MGDCSLDTQSSVLSPEVFPGAASSGPPSAQAYLKQLSAKAVHLCRGTARTHPAYRLGRIVQIAQRHVKGMRIGHAIDFLVSIASTLNDRNYAVGAWMGGLEGG